MRNYFFLKFKSFTVSEEEMFEVTVFKNVCVVSVDNLPNIDEKEPNNPAISAK